VLGWMYNALAIKELFGVGYCLMRYRSLLTERVRELVKLTFEVISQSL
jgi:hypothetical protein